MEKPSRIVPMNTSMTNDEILEAKISQPHSPTGSIEDRPTTPMSDGGANSRRFFSTLRKNDHPSRRMKVYMKAPRIVFRDHQQPILAASVIHNKDNSETLLLSGGEDKLIKVWSLSHGSLVATLEGHLQRVSGVVGFVADGYPALVISASWDDTVRIWNMDSCFTPMTPVHKANVEQQIIQTCRILRGHKNRVYCVTTLLNGPYGLPIAASGSADNTIRTWSIPDGLPLQVLEDHTVFTWNLCITSWRITEKPHRPFYGPVLISGCKNNTISVWQLESENPQRSKLTIRGHSSAVQSISAFEHDEHPMIITACRDKDIKVWSILTGEIVKVLKGHTSTVASVFAFNAPLRHGGVIVVSCSASGSIRGWKYNTGEVLRIFNGHTDEVNVVTAFASPEPDKDDVIIVSGSRDCTLRSWLLADEKSLRVLPHNDEQDGSKIRINCLEVYAATDDCIIVTGADDGKLRNWCVSRADDRDGLDTLMYSVEAHQAPIIGLGLYIPCFIVTPHITPKANGISGFKNYPNYLNETAIVTGCRNGYISISDLHTGDLVTPSFRAHDCVLTAISVCSGFRSSMAGNKHPHIDPFLVTGGEDNLVKVWSLVDCGLLHTLESHIFDVTSVCYFLPKPVYRTERKIVEQAASAATAKVLATTKSYAKMSRRGSHVSVEDFSGGQYKLPSPIVISGSMDNTVHLWSYATGKILGVLECGSVHVTSVASLELDSGPIIAAGDGVGVVRIWSLNAPYAQLATLHGHRDEVRALHIFNPEGVNPILVSGSLDSTMRVWDLQTMKEIRTIEGHKSDITSLHVFSPGGSDTSIASSSTDATVRVMFNFLGNLANIDVVHQLFRFDFDGKNNHILHTSTESNWPRISQMAAREGPERFFGLYYDLFGIALREGRPDFLSEFLPQSQIGLLKSNNELEDGDAHNNRGGLLRQAIQMRDSVSTRTIVDCWCTYLSTPPQPENEALYNKDFGQIAMDDLILLAETFPREFERLICSMKLIPVRNGQMTKGDRFLYEENHVTKMDIFQPSHSENQGNFFSSSRILVANTDSEKIAVALAQANKHARKSGLGGGMSSETTRRETRSRRQDSIAMSMFRALSMRGYAPSRKYQNNPTRRKSMTAIVSDVGAGLEKGLEALEGKNGRKRHQTYFFLPLRNAVQMDMLRAYTQTCQNLDSVEIFKSEAGSKALSFAWRAYGKRVHVASMCVYCFYVLIATTSTLTFQRARTEAAWFAVALIIIQLLFDVYSIVKEFHQLAANPFEYIVDIWNYIDLTVIVGGLSANIIRLYQFQDTEVSRILLSVTSIFSWFGVLYFLRAFESTGPLVSMILQISKDIRFLILCMMIVLVGFSQAFWLLSDEDHDLPFGTFQRSMFYSYVFLLGEYDPTAFNGLKHGSFAVALSTVYMLIVSILLLNLLIALMGDSYGSVKEKGLAQWKLEQALIITEMEGSLSAADRYCDDVVYFRKNTDDLRAESNSALAKTVADSKAAGTAVGTKTIDPAIYELQRQTAKLQKEQHDLAQMMRDSSSRLENAIKEVHLAVASMHSNHNIALSANTTFDERDDEETLGSSDVGGEALDTISGSMKLMSVVSSQPERRRSDGSGGGRG